jgi:hypothetical protein
MHIHVCVGILMMLHWKSRAIPHIIPRRWVQGPATSIYITYHWWSFRYVYTRTYMLHTTAGDIRPVYIDLALLLNLLKKIIPFNFYAILASYSACSAAHLISMQIKIVLLIIGRNKTAFSASNSWPLRQTIQVLFDLLSWVILIRACLPYIYSIWFFDPTLSVSN